MGNDKRLETCAIARIATTHRFRPRHLAFFPINGKSDDSASQIAMGFWGAVPLGTNAQDLVRLRVDRSGSAAVRTTDWIDLDCGGGHESADPGVGSHLLYFKGRELPVKLHSVQERAGSGPFIARGWPASDLAGRG